MCQIWPTTTSRAEDRHSRGQATGKVAGRRRTKSRADGGKSRGQTTDKVAGRRRTKSRAGDGQSGGQTADKVAGRRREKSRADGGKSRRRTTRKDRAKKCDSENTEVTSTETQAARTARSARAVTGSSYARQQSRQSITNGTIGPQDHPTPKRQSENDQGKIHGERKRQGGPPDGKHVTHRPHRFDDDMTKRARGSAQRTTRHTSDQRQLTPAEQTGTIRATCIREQRLAMTPANPDVMRGPSGDQAQQAVQRHGQNQNPATARGDCGHDPQTLGRRHRRRPRVTAYPRSASCKREHRSSLEHVSDRLRRLELDDTSSGYVDAGLADWVASHVRAFEFLGGCSECHPR